jgi:hypothetical protein
MKRFLALSAIALGLAATQAGAEPIQFHVPANIEPAQSGLTRAEVIADYHVWRLAGLHDLTRGEIGVDTNGYQYRKAYATYLHLRQSPQFAQLVSELQQRPNARVVAGRSQPPAHAAN